MDREHPIPQEVSTYEFRLVGDMTIKQFMQVASGALISLLLYSSSIAPYVKWPLIVISFMSGIALAFFPIQDRPLSKWIILFIKAIYSPTFYVWDKNASRHQFFQAEETAVAGGANTLLSTSPIQVQQNTSPSIVPEVGEVEESKLDQTEQAFLTKLDSQFAAPTGSSVVNQNLNVPASPQNTTQIAVPNDSKMVIEKSEPVQTEAPPGTQQTTSTGSEVSPSASQPFNPAIKAAIFSTDASPPSPPTRPNVVVGQILDTDGKIVDGAILEIKDVNGRSVRALRSNRLGHFMIVTPLVDGSYQLTVEKEGLDFDPVAFDAVDRIIPPIAIWAKTKEGGEANQTVQNTPVGQVNQTNPVTTNETNETNVANSGNLYNATDSNQQST